MSEQPYINEEELVFNVVWTGDTFGLLRYFVASLMLNTAAKFRFVANACTDRSLSGMRAGIDLSVEVYQPCWYSRVAKRGSITGNSAP